MNQSINLEDLPKVEDVGFTKSIVFVDVETSGLQWAIPDACTLSIGALFMDRDGSVVSEFYGVILPTDEQIEKMSPEAMAVNGLTPEILRAEGKPAEEVWKAFADWLKENKITATKTRYVGQNPLFDLAFIEAEAPTLIKKYGWVKDRVLDIIQLYMTAESKFIVPYLGKGRKGKKGNNIAMALAVEGEPEVHNALEGARLNYRNFTRLAQIQTRWIEQGEKL